MIIRNLNIDCLNIKNKNKTGVYLIKNINTNKNYIGSAAGKGGFFDRFKHHIFDLDHEKHHSQKLQRAFIKENKNYNKFEFSIIEYCEPNKCIDREQYWINYFNSYNQGYNSTPIAGSLLNSKRTEQQKRNMSLSKQKMSEIIVTNILNDYNETDLTFSEIAIKYKTSCTIISYIINNQRYYPDIKNKISFNKKRYKYVFVSPRNEIITSNNLSKFATKNNLSRALLCLILNKKLKKLEHKGWLAFYKDEFSLEKLNEVRIMNQGKIHKISNGTIEYSFNNVPKFCRDNKFNETPIYYLLKGQLKNYKGFKVI